MKKYEESIRIGSLRLDNRLVMPPMATEASKDGKVTDSLIAYYLERAGKSGVSLIITEHSYIDQKGKASPNQVSLAGDL